MPQIEDIDCRDAGGSSTPVSAADSAAYVLARPTLFAAINTSIRKFLSKEKQVDTKTIFDSLRNMGICIAMLLGLPSLYKATDYLPHYAHIAAGCFVIGSTIGLALANLLWTLHNLEEKSALWAKGLVIIIGSLVILAFVVNAFNTLPRPH